MKESINIEKLTKQIMTEARGREFKANNVTLEIVGDEETQVEKALAAELLNFITNDSSLKGRGDIHITIDLTGDPEEEEEEGAGGDMPPMPDSNDGADAPAEEPAAEAPAADDAPKKGDNPFANDDAPESKDDDDEDKE